jgi:hypothetical protein
MSEGRRIMVERVVLLLVIAVTLLVAAGYAA